MPKHISAAEPAVTAKATPLMRVVLVTMDSHLASAAERAGRTLARTLPGLSFTVHAAAEWGDVVIATMLFMEDHFLPVLPAL